MREADIRLERTPVTGPAPLGAWAYLGARLLLGCVFVYAGLGKLMDPAAFATVIAGYGLVPEPLLGPVALGLPLLEVLAGLGLVLDLRGSLGTVLALTLMFMAVLGWGIALGLDVDCGCYGPQDPEGAAYHGLRDAMWRDAGLLAVIGFAYWWRRRTGWAAVRQAGKKTTGGV